MEINYSNFELDSAYLNFFRTSLYVINLIIFCIINEKLTLNNVILSYF